MIIGTVERQKSKCLDFRQCQNWDICWFSFQHVPIFKRLRLKKFKRVWFGLLCTKPNKKWFGSLNGSDFGRQYHLKPNVFVQISDGVWNPNSLTTKQKWPVWNPKGFGFQTLYMIRFHRQIWNWTEIHGLEFRIVEDLIWKP